MARARTFSKAEIMDAARAAADTGMNARLLKSGDIEFLHGITNNDTNEESDSPENALARWMNEGQSRRRA
ncbi:hypothetical protein [Brucella pseudogrignonensis]|uniref:Uncharacterized protein n=1 Tax=Brucella pseudogrignonensis TaxID=419475 RepID=A0ABU1M8E0_9HYPH|nr:hypothetical protein [Brucella pseudogrignonensis]MDR6431976.1 hypothetical protein [Brucella pseudogrignonensis]